MALILRPAAPDGFVDNIQWVHKDINMLKGSIDVQKFVHLCRLVACYQDGKLSESVTSK